MKLLVLSGGRHPYDESTPVLDQFLQDAGHDVTVTEDASILSDENMMSSFDSVVFNTRRENLPDFEPLAFNQAEKTGITNYISNGGGFVLSLIHI